MVRSVLNNISKTTNRRSSAGTGSSTTPPTTTHPTTRRHREGTRRRSDTGGSGTIADVVENTGVGVGEDRSTYTAPADNAGSLSEATSTTTSSTASASRETGASLANTQEVQHKWQAAGEKVNKLNDDRIKEVGKIVLEQLRNISQLSLNDKEKLKRRTYLVNKFSETVDQAEKQENLDKKIADMDADSFGSYLANFQNPNHSNDSLPTVQLHGGGLPSGVITIISEFYSPAFKLEPMLDKTNVDSILEKLVAGEEARIYAQESSSGSKISPKDRKFYNVSDSKKIDAARKKLANDLRSQAQQEANKRSVTPKQPNQLRSWHLNDTGKLPRKILKKNIQSGFNIKKPKKPEIDSSWSSARRALHNQWEEDVKASTGFQSGYVTDFKDGKDAFYGQLKDQEPGYVEINPAGWRQANDQGRLIYDYIDDRWFITTDHYHEGFWEIKVPREVQDNLQSNNSENSDTDALSRVNNCLIDSLVNAAINAGLQATVPVNLRQLREDLEAQGLGNVGEMLYADQSVVESIMSAIGLQATPVILIDENGTSQEVAGGNSGQVLQIYHTGQFHYVAEPTTQSQVDAIKGGQSNAPDHEEKKE